MNPTILLQAGLTKKNLKSWIDCGVNTIYYQRGLRSAFSWSLISPPQDWCPHLRWSQNGLIPSKDAIRLLLLASLSQGRFLGSSWFFFTLLSIQRNDIAVNLHSCKSHEVCAYVLHPLMHPTGFSSMHNFKHRLRDTLGVQNGRKSIAHVRTASRV